MDPRRTPSSTAIPGPGAHSKVNSTLVAASAYTDTGLTNGTIYFYVVRSVDSAGNESESSTEASAKPRGGVSVLVYNWSTGVWETIDPPHAAGSTLDRTFTWTTGSPQQYVAPGNREIKIRAKGTRSSSFRHVSDFVRFTVQQP